MPKTLAEVTQDAAALSCADQLRLARHLLDLSENLPSQPADAQAEWDAEIERRRMELQTGAVQPVPLVEVKQRMHARLSS